MKIIRTILAVCLVAVLLVGFLLFRGVKGSLNVDGEKELLLTPQTTVEDVRQSLSEIGASGMAFDMVSWYTDYKVLTGRYVIRPEDCLLDVMRRLKRHEQNPLRVHVPSVRSMQQLAGRLSERLMLDSASLADALLDTALLSTLGYDAATSLSMVVPNTYEVYWDIAPQQLVKRLGKEHDAFWNKERQAKADAMGLTRVQVATLASIVAEETANNAEKQMIAGLYYNRVRRGMKLEADPTVKFALQDFGLRRVLNKHLEVESPYNTYKVVGLPPGPIRIPDIVDIDAVLDHVQHDYLYMCAKEDFSGTHNFARTFAEHRANASRYVAALNRRGIK